MAFYPGCSLDASTSLLIARLLLDDIEDVETSRAGPSRAGSASDEQVAFSIQAELIRAHYPHALTMRNGTTSRQPETAGNCVQKHPPVPTSGPEGISDPKLPPAVPGTRLLSMRRHVSQDPLSERKIRVCVVCTDSISASDRCVNSSCGHFYCLECFSRLVERATEDEALYPISCCRTPLPVKETLVFISPTIATAFRLKEVELKTPPSNRLYCSKKLCSNFLGTTVGASKDVRCSKCSSLSCSRCKSIAHPTETCAEKIALSELQELVREKKWKPCPDCHAIVERIDGCSHIVCRCRSEFCYLCGARYGKCVSHDGL